ncbi:MAG: hypothetical protein JWQ40_4449 [Segetibacter sp.]|jgi:hypothetical protein|nr:hypothetical protein [Segetibacter sp.]
MEQKTTSPAIKGLIISLILIVFSLILQFLDLSSNKGLGSISLLLFFAGIIWSGIIYANQLHGNITFGSIFAHAFKVAAAVTAIMTIFTIISIKFISPEQIDVALREARTGMEEKNMSDDQIDQAMSITRKFFLPFAIGGVLFIYMVVGLIGALIGAAVAKKNPETPFVQQG